jgi:predicted MFS family arabinose efflux permease
MLRSDPQAQEAVSAANVANMQISIAAGSAIGGLLVDSAGLAVVYTTAGAIALASAAIALTAGTHPQPPPTPASANPASQSGS